MRRLRFSATRESAVSLRRSQARRQFGDGVTAAGARVGDTSPGRDHQYQPSTWRREQRQSPPTTGATESERRRSYAGSSVGRSRRTTAVGTSREGEPVRSGLALALPRTRSVSFSAVNPDGSGQLALIRHSVSLGVADVWIFLREDSAIVAPPPTSSKVTIGSRRKRLKRSNLASTDRDGRIV